MSVPAFFAFDLETSGLDPNRHEILSIAAILLDDSLNELETFEAFALPSGAVDPEAAAINGYTYEKWVAKGAKTQQDLLTSIKSLRKDIKLIPLGHNTKFDLSFLEALFRRYDEFSFFRQMLDHHSLDTVAASLIFDFVKFGKKDSSYKLKNVGERFGIREWNEHDALDDIRATVQLFRTITGALGSPEKFQVQPPQNKSNLLAKASGGWTMQRGKFKGQTLEHVATVEPDYLDWALANISELSPEQKEAILKAKLDAP